MIDPTGPLAQWIMAVIQHWIDNPLGPNGPFVQGFIVITGVIGQQYVSDMNVKGFYYWFASNIALIAVSFYFGSYGMMCLYLYFGVMSVRSIFRWKRLQASQSPT